MRENTILLCHFWESPPYFSATTERKYHNPLSLLREPTVLQCHCWEKIPLFDVTTDRIHHISMSAMREPATSMSVLSDPTMLRCHHWEDPPAPVTPQWENFSHFEWRKRCLMDQSLKRHMRSDGTIAKRNWSEVTSRSLTRASDDTLSQHQGQSKRRKYCKHPALKP